jgi:D-cysteine desulfhydrase
MLVARRHRNDVVMPPGGATPLGALGAAAAAFELGEQIRAGLAPPPRRIVLPIGSACTSAGLVAGLTVASAVGAWPWPVPVVHAVRVTPWPVTSRWRTAHLAQRTVAWIARHARDRRVEEVSLRELLSRLVVDRRELGPGYGVVTARAQRALDELASWPRLDGVYSAKAAAAARRLQREDVGPLLFWSTKSHKQLAPPSLAALRHAPVALRRWLAGDRA